jgi:hypothetical protein
MHLSIKKKFEELGYNVLDLGRLWKHPEAVRTTPLTDRGKYLVPFTIFCVLTIPVWESIRPIIEPEIRSRKEQRLLRDGPYKCLRCHADSKRQFVLMGVTDHLAAKYLPPFVFQNYGCSSWGL